MLAHIKVSQAGRVVSGKAQQSQSAIIGIGNALTRIEQHETAAHAGAHFREHLVFAPKRRRNGINASISGDPKSRSILRNPHAARNYIVFLFGEGGHPKQPFPACE
ncbi:hypothetical protein KDAU_16210 [Dictyobacter aurantiacus]|uniref:Uncharacterized protein n=1 Tax=Dictyobacter aurantiacus TaxID=1936993 RepID=A0A401ZBS6_9CHLR|nr:hypothetical protein KDAU_16210 [Dictyobacter aurantiacus]